MKKFLLALTVTAFCAANSLATSSSGVPTNLAMFLCKPMAQGTYRPANTLIMNTNGYPVFVFYVGSKGFAILLDGSQGAQEMCSSIKTAKTANRTMTVVSETSPQSVITSTPLHGIGSWSYGFTVPDIIYFN